MTDLTGMTLEQIEADITETSQQMLDRSNLQAMDHAYLQQLFAERNRRLIKPVPVSPAWEGETNG